MRIRYDDQGNAIPTDDDGCCRAYRCSDPAVKTAPNGKRYCTIHGPATCVHDTPGQRSVEPPMPRIGGADARNPLPLANSDNLAAAARDFDGNWDAELAVLDADPAPTSVDLSDWLIDIDAPVQLDTPQHSKLEEPQVSVPGAVEASGTFAGTWDNAPTDTPGATVTVQLWNNKPRYQLRRILQWLGLPVATRTLTTAPAVIIKRDVTRDEQGATVLDMEYRLTGHATTIDEQAHLDGERIGFLFGCLIAWGLIIVGAYTIFRSMSGG